MAKIHVTSWSDAQVKDPQQCAPGDSKELKRSPNRLDWDILAEEALELARLMAPGLERNEALKLASLLRRFADARGLIFARRGRPRK
jgi:hypothetical protein